MSWKYCPKVIFTLMNTTTSARRLFMTRLFKKRNPKERKLSLGPAFLNLDRMGPRYQLFSIRLLAFIHNIGSFPSWKKVYYYLKVALLIPTPTQSLRLMDCFISNTFIPLFSAIFHHQIRPIGLPCTRRAPSVHCPRPGWCCLHGGTRRFRSKTWSQLRW